MAPTTAHHDKPIIDAGLLHALLETEHPLTVSDLCARFHQRPGQMLGQLQRLRDAGCLIQEHPTQGLRLLQAGLGCFKDYLRFCDGLSDRRRIIQVYRTTSSTQDAARQLLLDQPGSCHNALILADHQTAGRGRLGRPWTAPPGSGLLWSLVRTGPVDSPLLSPDRLVLATAAALAQAIDAAVGALNPWVKIKWPNDLMVGDRKLGGILVETIALPARQIAAIIGVGLNVNLQARQIPDHPPELAARLTSLAMHHHAVDRLKLLARCDRACRDMLDQSDPAGYLQAWRARCNLVGQTLTVRSEGRTCTGVVIDLHPLDGLIMRTQQDQIIHLHAAVTTVL